MKLRAMLPVETLGLSPRLPAIVPASPLLSQMQTFMRMEAMAYPQHSLQRHHSHVTPPPTHPAHMRHEARQSSRVRDMSPGADRLWILSARSQTLTCQYHSPQVRTLQGRQCSARPVSGCRVRLSPTLHFVPSPMLLSRTAAHTPPLLRWRNLRRLRHSADTSLLKPALTMQPPLLLTPTGSSLQQATNHRQVTNLLRAMSLQHSKHLHTRRTSLLMTKKTSQHNQRRSP